MKKIIALILCVMVLCAMPVVAFAEENTTEVTENTATEEIATESENSADEPIVPDATVPEATTPKLTVPEKIVGFIKDNFEGTSFLSLAVTVVVYIFYEIKKHRGLNGTIGVLNNNAVSIAKDNAKFVSDALAKAEAIAENSDVVVKNVLAEAVSIAEVVKGYKEDIVSSIEEIRKMAEENQSLKDMLLSVQKTLETLKMADLEFGNEVAELLVLANIPVSKKDELYARHRAAVDAIATADTTEVINDDGKET